MEGALVYVPVHLEGFQPDTKTVETARGELYLGSKNPDYQVFLDAQSKEEIV
jgi:hypothetical protein